MDGIFVALVLFVGALALIFGTALSLDNWSCSNKAKIMELDHYWSVTTSCMVKTDHGWYPLERVWSNGVQP